MARYRRFVDTADNLIDRYGSVGRLIKIETAGDAWNPTQTEVAYTVKAVVTEYREVGEDILRTDKRIVISAKGLRAEPKPNDFIEVGGTKYNIVNVITKKPADTVICYELQGRV